jgi:hypothetical protein
MRSTTASIISCVGCATVITHGLSLGSSRMGVRPIIGVFASLPTCAIAMAAGTPEVPMSTSTFSSSISLRALRPAVVGSEPSSSTMSCTLRPFTSGLVGQRGLHALGVRHAQRGVRPRQRHAEADLQVGRQRAGNAAGGQRRGECAARQGLHQALHVVAPVRMVGMNRKLR